MQSNLMAQETEEETENQRDMFLQILCGLDVNIHSNASFYRVNNIPSGDWLQYVGNIFSSFVYKNMQPQLEILEFFFLVPNLKLTNLNLHFQAFQADWNSYLSGGFFISLNSAQQSLAQKCGKMFTWWNYVHKHHHVS